MTITTYQNITDSSLLVVAATVLQSIQTSYLSSLLEPETDTFIVVLLVRVAPYPLVVLKVRADGSGVEEDKDVYSEPSTTSYVVLCSLYSSGHKRCVLLLSRWTTVYICE
jgi:hypothetical protein